MTLIKEKHILEAAEFINGLDENQLESTAEKNTLKNPLFLSYLVSASLEFENDDLLEFIVYYYNIFCEAIENQGLDLKEIDDDFIDNFQEEYLMVLDEYQETDDEDLIKSLCNQPAMLEFFMDEVHGEDEEGEELSEDMKSQLFIVGIAMITLFGRTIQSKQ